MTKQTISHHYCVVPGKVFEQSEETVCVAGVVQCGNVCQEQLRDMLYSCLCLTYLADILFEVLSNLTIFDLQTRTSALTWPPTENSSFCTSEMKIMQKPVKKKKKREYNALYYQQGSFAANPTY